MDIVIQIVDKPATHDLSYAPAKESRRLRKGDIVGVYPAEDIGTWDGSEYIPNEPIGSPRCGFVFITSVPNVPWPKVQNIILPEKTEETVLYRSKFRVRVADLPQVVIDKMLVDRHTTFTWTQVKNFIKRTLTSDLLSDTDIT